MNSDRGRAQTSGSSYPSRMMGTDFNDSTPRAVSQSATMSRAEIFEDEKKRIVESCFAKLDEKAHPLQSYITHVRVEEDSNFPSSPPPPDAPPQSKKPRVVIVAVKNSGRVWMHKARENTDKTFQIGKSWPLEELQAVESFTNSLPKDAAYQQRCSWAGPTGFIISMAKPYYWQAKTAREKDYFIDSLVKIYRKYTSGRLPQLIGFDPRDEERMRGAAIASAGSEFAGSRGPSNSLQALDAAQQRPMIVNQPSPGQSQPRGDGPSTNGGPDITTSGILARSMGIPTVTTNTRPLQSSAEASPSQLRPLSLSQPVQPPQFPLQPPSSQPQSNINHQIRPQQFDDQVTRQGSIHSQPVHSRVQALTVNPLYAKPAPAESDKGTNSAFTGTSSQSTVIAGPSRYAADPAPLRAAMNEQARATAFNSSTYVAPLNTAFQTTSTLHRQPSKPSPISSIAPSTTSQTVDPSGRTFSFGSESASSETNRQTVPERRRPPMQDNEFNGIPQSGSQTSRHDDDQAIRPLALKIPGNRTSTPQQTPNSSALSFSPDLSSAQSARGGTSDTSSMTGNAAQPSGKIDMPVADSPVSTNALDVVKPEPRFRPGLGPMTGKTSSAEGRFNKTPNVHATFKPRAGGAGERLLGIKAKPVEGPDGITGVVPAPSLARAASQNVVKPLHPSQASDISTPDLEPKQDPMNQVMTAPITDGELESIKTPFEHPDTPHTHSNPSQTQSPVESPQPQSISSTIKAESDNTSVTLIDRAHSKRRPAQHSKGLIALGINPSIFGGRELRFENVLAEVGWEDDNSHKKNIDEIENNLRRDIGRLEAGSWLDHTGQRDERVELVKGMLDRAISECEEMEGLLTLYAVELGTLNDDIAYIEAQQQGLQVQAANQKLLHNELQQLVDTVSVTDAQLEPLRHNSLDDSYHLERIESCLLLLSNALFRIDPTIIQQGLHDMTDARENGTQNMRAFEERRLNYIQHAVRFLDRLSQHMDMSFSKALSRASEGHSRSSSLRSLTGSTNHLNARDVARQGLWRYSPLMLFAKKMEPKHWNDLLKLYQDRARGVYVEDIRSNVSSWKSTTRKPTGDETEALFTAQEKETDGTGRKLKVVRSQTLSKGFRSVSSEKRVALLKSQDVKLHPAESFAGSLDEVIPLVTAEQNFVVDFFHATTLENYDFADIVSATPPGERRGTNLSSRKAVEPDRLMAKKVADVMSTIFHSLPNELQHLAEWSTSGDSFQIVGVLFALERKKRELANTNQEFVLRTLQGLSEQLSTRFMRFVDEQIRAIEDTKVKIKKRKGVIGFIRVFPNFSATIENIAQLADAPECIDTRTLIDTAYGKINKSMFDSLKFIAKESPSAAASAGLHAPRLGHATEIEDKEALNHHILLIENMYTYYSEVDERGVDVLGQWRGKAMLEMSEHQEQYVRAIIRRPIGRLLDFLDSMDNHLLVSPGRDNPAGIPAAHANLSRSVFKKIVAANDTKEIRRGIETLRKRIEKHFAEADAPGKLITMTTEECERKYNDAYDRLEKVASRVYEGTVELEFSKQDVAQSFRR